MDGLELVKLAAARNAPVTLTLPTAGLSRQHRTRLVAIDDGVLYIEAVGGTPAAFAELVTARESVQVEFRHETQNVKFSAGVLEFRRDYPLNATMAIEVLKLEMPSSVQVVQRRNSYRVSITPDAEVTFQIWRIGEKDDVLAKPNPAMAMQVDVRDFSLGGLGGTWKRQKEDPPALAASQRLRVDTTFRDSVVTLDARVCFAQNVPNTDNTRLGVKFSMSDTSLADRQKMASLNKVFSELQRQELRRKKLAK